MCVLDHSLVVVETNAERATYRPNIRFKKNIALVDGLHETSILYFVLNEKLNCRSIYYNHNIHLINIMFLNLFL